MARFVQCPGCGHSYPWKTSLEGRRVQCKHCGNAFRVPALAEAEQTAASAPSLGSFLEEELSKPYHLAVPLEVVDSDNPFAAGAKLGRSPRWSGGGYSRRSYGGGGVGGFLASHKLMIAVLVVSVLLFFANLSMSSVVPIAAFSAVGALAWGLFVAAFGLLPPPERDESPAGYVFLVLAFLQLLYVLGSITFSLFNQTQRGAPAAYIFGVIVGAVICLTIWGAITSLFFFLYRRYGFFKVAGWTQVVSGILALPLLFAMPSLIEAAKNSKRNADIATEQPWSNSDAARPPPPFPAPGPPPSSSQPPSDALAADSNPFRPADESPFRPADANSTVPADDNPFKAVADGGAGDSGSSETAKDVGWSVEVDPPLESFTLFSGEKFASLPPIPGQAKLVVPAVSSPFIAVFAEVFGRGNGCGIVDLRTGRAAGQLSLNADPGDHQALSPDGKLVASTTQFGNVGLGVWAVETGQKIYEYLPGKRGFRFLTFSQPDRLIAVQDTWGEFTILVIDPIRGNEIGQFTMKGRGLDGESTLAISPGGRYLAAVYDGALHVHDLGSRQLVGRSPLPSSFNNDRSAQGLAFSPDGTEVAAAMPHFRELQLCSWSVSTGEVTFERQYETSPAANVPGVTWYRGAVLDWVPDKTAWLLEGHVLLDRKTGEKIWIFPETDANPRKMIDGERILWLSRRRAGGTELAIATVPKDKVVKASEAVQAGGVGVDAALPPITRADTSAAQSLVLNEPVDSWSVRPDPAITASKLPTKPVLFEASPGDLRQVRFSRDTSRVTVLRAVPPPGGTLRIGAEPVGNVLEAYGFPTGRRQKEISLPMFYYLMDVSADGNLALAATFMAQPPQRDRLDVWAFEQGRHAVGWRPYGDKEKVEDREVQYAAFVNNQHVVTLNKSGDLVLWKLPECKAVYKAEYAEPILAMSPGGKYLAVKAVTDPVPRIIDAATGTPAGLLESPAALEGILAVAFRRDGKMLAAVNRDAVYTWSLEDGKLKAEVPLPTPGSGPARWSGNSHLLLSGWGGQRRLVDVDRRFVVWSYRLQACCEADGSPDQRYWYAAEGQSTRQGKVYGLLAVDVPSAAVRTRLEGKSIEELALIYPGSKVSVSASVPGDDATAVTSAMRERLENLGVIVADGAPVQVSISAEEQGTGNQIEARRFDGSEVQRFEQRQVVIKVRVSDASGRKYERETSVGMRALGTVGSTNAREELTREMREQARNSAANLTFPKIVFPDGFENGLGTSTLSRLGEVLGPPPDQKATAGVRQP